MNENDISEVKEYFQMRADQMGPNYTIVSSYEYLEKDGEVWGVRVLFSSMQANTYQSVFVLESHRGKGLMKEFAVENVAKTGVPFITADECNIAEWFRKHRIPFLLVPLTI